MIVVRRSAYEEVGGYRTDLRMVLDWEMWVRIATRRRFWYEPSVLACYRDHSASETARLRDVGADLADLRPAIAVVAGYVPEGLRRTVGTDLRGGLHAAIVQAILRRLARGDHRAPGAGQRDLPREPADVAGPGHVGLPQAGPQAADRRVHVAPGRARAGRHPGRGGPAPQAERRV